MAHVFTQLHLTQFQGGNLSSGQCIAKFVLHDIDLHFQSQTFQTLLSKKR